MPVTPPPPMDMSTDFERIGRGFPGERLRVLPRPLVDRALMAPVTSELLVTDVGFFPRARHHWFARRAATEHIVIICVAGMGECQLEGQTHRVRTGEALIVPAGVPHLYQADADDPWTIWWLHVTGRQSDELVGATRAAVDSPVFRVGDMTRASALVDTVLRRLETDETHATLMAASGAAWHLLTVLAADGRPLHQGERTDPIPEVVAHIREHVGDRLAVAELAALAGFSSSHFSALFRKATGFGVLEYQTRLRMSIARTLLDTTDRTITSIANEVGYDDGLYFSRQFRRIHDLSPSQYRSRVRGVGHQF